MAARMDTCTRWSDTYCELERKEEWNTHQIVSEQQDALLMSGDSEHEHRPNGGKDTGGGDDEPLSLEPLCQPATAYDGDEFWKRDLSTSGLFWNN